MIEIKYAQVKFDNYDKLYNYMTLIDLKEGDKVLVNDRGTDDTYKIVTVVNVTSTPNNIATRCILAKVDMSEHLEKYEKLHKQYELEEKMNKRYKEMCKQQLWEQASLVDGEMKALMDEYKNI